MRNTEALTTLIFSCKAFQETENSHPTYKASYSANPTSTVHSQKLREMLTMMSHKFSIFPERPRGILRRILITQATRNHGETVVTHSSRACSRWPWAPAVGCPAAGPPACACPRRPSGSKRTGTARSSRHISYFHKSSFEFRLDYGSKRAVGGSPGAQRLSASTQAKEGIQPRRGRRRKRWRKQSYELHHHHQEQG